MNCGDWVESSTALVERQDGQFEIIAWNTSQQLLIEAATEDDAEAEPARRAEPLAA
jgi:hypothetical protein